MKRLLLLLVFLNVVYFFWGTPVGENKRLEQHQAPLYKKSELEALVLVGDEDAAMLEKQVLLDSNTKQPAAECYIVGDFAKESDAKELSKALSSYVRGVSVITSEVLGDFWVVYPSRRDGERPLHNVETLKAIGVDDLWLVPNGSNKGVISLGLFATVGSAEKRLKALSEKSIEAEIIRRKKYRYGIKFITNDDLSPIQDNLDGFETGENISIRKIAC